MKRARAGLRSIAREKFRRAEDAPIPVERLVFGAPMPWSLDEFASQVGDVALPSRSLSAWPDLAQLGETAGLTASAWHADTVVVKRVWRSDCFAVVAGHDTVAAAVTGGASAIPATILAGTTKTPLQSLLLDMGWLDGQIVLYQPVDSLDVATWPVVRACTDRLQRMRDVIATLDLGDSAAFLDVASSYGWFVANMTADGFDAWGIERDVQARILGPAVYGLDPERILIGDCETLLPEVPSFDVVSCLSLLHHFVRGLGTCSAEELMARLSRVTKRVLFIDTGEAHEKWLRRQAPEWTPAFIQQWLTQHGDFDEVVPLGVDHDNIGIFTGNYQRTLFTCIRK